VGGWGGRGGRDVSTERERERERERESEERREGGERERECPRSSRFMKKDRARITHTHAHTHTRARAHKVVHHRHHECTTETIIQGLRVTLLNHVTQASGWSPKGGAASDHAQRAVEHCCATRYMPSSETSTFTHLKEMVVGGLEEG
jgi:hypothetical protein